MNVWTSHVVMQPYNLYRSKCTPRPRGRRNASTWEAGLQRWPSDGHSDVVANTPPQQVQSGLEWLNQIEDECLCVDDLWIFDDAPATIDKLAIF